jgi:hypothetical protein
MMRLDVYLLMWYQQQQRDASNKWADEGRTTYDPTTELGRCILHESLQEKRKESVGSCHID